MRSEQAAWEQQIDLVRGKVALAAGAAAGIGRAAARKFAEEGAKAVIGNLEELTRGCWKRSGAVSLPSQNDAVDRPALEINLCSGVFGRKPDMPGIHPWQPEAKLSRSVGSGNEGLSRNRRLDAFPG